MSEEQKKVDSFAKEVVSNPEIRKYYELFTTQSMDIDTAIDLLVTDNTVYSYYVLVHIFGSDQLYSEFGWRQLTENDLIKRGKLGAKSQLFCYLQVFILKSLREGRFKIKKIVDTNIEHLSFQIFYEAFNAYSLKRIRKLENQKRKLQNKKFTAKYKNYKYTPYFAEKEVYDSPYANVQNKTYKPQKGSLCDVYEYGLSDW